MAKPTIDETPRVGRCGPGDPLPKYLLYRRHLFAYETASVRIPKGGICLDIGAGLGYGLSLLASATEKVAALDLSDLALRNLPELRNLERVKGDATELPFMNGSFNSIVAFQLIEHVARADAVRVVLEILRVLRPGGKAFISTPNARWRLLPGERPRNPHHIHEFTPRDMVRFVEEVSSSSCSLFGIVGRNGAQEIERARVAPSMLRAYGGIPGRVVHRAWRSLPSRRTQHALQKATPEDDDSQWFDLTPDFADGLDFFIELERDRQ